MKPQISVIIPYYKKIYEIELVLKALSLQDYDRTQFEIVLVDDGSEDEVASIIDHFNRQLYIKYLKLEHTGNRGRNRNLGVRNCNGEWIILLDSDILVDHHFISNIALNVLGKKKIAVFGYRNNLCEFDKNFVDSTVIEKMFSLVENLPAFRDGRLIGSIYEKKNNVEMDGKWQLFWSCCACLRKEDFNAVGGFDEVFSKNWGAEDVELGYRLYRSGCVMRMLPDVTVYHIFHSEDHENRKCSMENNYAIFVKKHPHWSVELFIKEYTTMQPEMIELQEKIKKKKYLINHLQNPEQFIEKIPEKTLLCGIQCRELLESVKVEKAFIPECTVESEKIINIIGIHTAFPDNHFNLCVISKRYECVSYGIFCSLIKEAGRIARKVIFVDEKGVQKQAGNVLIKYPSAKKVMFVSSVSNHYSLNRDKINLALALSKRGVKTGYRIDFDNYKEYDLFAGPMRTEDQDKLDCMCEIMDHGMRYIGDHIPTVFDWESLKQGGTIFGGYSVLWAEKLYHNQEQDMLNLSKRVQEVFVKRESEKMIYPPGFLVRYLPVGIDVAKIDKLNANDLADDKNKPFRFIWAENATSPDTNLHIILKCFDELFNNNKNVEIVLICTYNNSHYTDDDFLSRSLSLHKRAGYRNRQLYFNSYLDELRRLYGNRENIIFKTGEFTEEQYCAEIMRSDCLISLNACLNINPFVLESAAMGKKSLVLNNSVYDGYLNTEDIIRVDSYPAPVLTGGFEFEMLVEDKIENRKYYLFDLPEIESVTYELKRIVNDPECLLIENERIKEIRETYDWNEIGRIIYEII